MLNLNYDTITNWTVSAVQFVYRLLVQNTYFILSNSLFLILLFFIRLNTNNFIFFIGPIYFLLVSFSVQFGAFRESKETISMKEYVTLYKEIVKNNWKTFVFYTMLICMLVLDFRILRVSDLRMIVYPLLITGCFLLSSMFFVLLISIDSRSKDISFKQKLMWSLLVSYRLPTVTIVNVIWILVTLFFLQNFSLAYLCFFGGAINYYIWLNLNRKFSIDLFYEQIK